ncbi:MAG TPA: polysaccharide deacetylase family protein [Chitinophagaceae bacterium]|nr:polysaccharide deacetylase family protein [Chitinophagaceae bacterium]
MLIYATSIQPRLRYIAEFISSQLDDSLLLLTSDKVEFSAYDGVKINYSDETITTDEFRINPVALLFETGIKEQELKVFQSGNYKAFFKTQGDFNFDIFAASFYLLSRYEEYLPHKKDIYGRYAYENSLAYKENFLDIPLVNIWLKHFKEALISKFPGSSFTESHFRFLPTYDIDEAYSFKHKSWKRSAGGAIKDLLVGRFQRFRKRRKVLNGSESDPFDSYTWIDDLHRPYNIRPNYFFLIADKNSRYDKNILPAEPVFQLLVRQHAGKYKIGVHPSWRSGDQPDLIKQEIETLEEITKLKITSSRQHYIRFTLPETYRHLISAGIKEDFSMGYGSINGFRASVASPFYWYDLEKEQATHLKLYPFCYMEANSFYEQKFSTKQAFDEMMHYYKEVKKINGTLITIWHNTFLGTEQKFKGWREVYYKFFSIATA